MVLDLRRFGSRELPVHIGGKEGRQIAALEGHGETFVSARAALELEDLAFGFRLGTEIHGPGDGDDALRDGAPEQVLLKELAAAVERPITVPTGTSRISAISL
jgi:hypothetical protein